MFGVETGHRKRVTVVPRHGSHADPLDDVDEASM
jgi:hypothetical protein